MEIDVGSAGGPVEETMGPGEICGALEGCMQGLRIAAQERDSQRCPLCVGDIEDSSLEYAEDEDEPGPVCGAGGGGAGVGAGVATVPTGEFFVEDTSLCWVPSLCTCKGDEATFRPGRVDLWFCSQLEPPFLTQKSVLSLLEVHEVEPPMTPFRFGVDLQTMLTLYRTTIPCISREYWNQPGVRNLVARLVATTQQTLVSVVQCSRVDSGTHKAAVLGVINERWHELRLVVHHLYLHLPMEEVDIFSYSRRHDTFVSRLSGIYGTDFAMLPVDCVVGEQPDAADALKLREFKVHRRQFILNMFTMVHEKWSRQDAQWKRRHVRFHVHLLFQCLSTLTRLALICQPVSVCFFVEVAKFVKRVFSSCIVLATCEPEYMDTLYNLTLFACRIVQDAKLKAAYTSIQTMTTTMNIMELYQVLLAVWEALGVATVAFSGATLQQWTAFDNIPSAGPRYLLWNVGTRIEDLKLETRSAIDVVCSSKHGVPPFPQKDVLRPTAHRLKDFVETFGYMNLDRAVSRTTLDS